MPKITETRPKVRSNPLHVELSNGHGVLRTESKTKENREKARLQRAKKSQENGGYVDASLSRKILQIAKEQQDEVNQEERASRPLYSLEGDDESDIEPSNYGRDQEDDFWEDEDEDYEDYQEIETLEIDPDEDALFQRYIGQNGQDDEEEGTGITLADKIMEKIREKEALEARLLQDNHGPGSNEDGPPEGVMLPPKVIEVYMRVGELLSRYRSGKLPKAFKIIPSLKNWQDVLYVTQPESWTTNAVYEATKLFVSNLPAKQSQTFITEILLPRFQEEIRQNKTLNYHIYRSLKKSLYKPAAFFKGFLFPLCKSGVCTLKEAIIVGSVLSKVSVPALHSAAALMRLTEMDYSGPNSLFIKILLDKKYALPYKVVDSVVFHFIRFKQHRKELPVVWHQSFLVFAQRYKNDITEDQREALMEVITAKTHASISPEIRRELMSGATRPIMSSMEID